MAAAALAVGVAVVLVLLPPRPVQGATGNVVVSFEVTSHTALTDQCAAPAAYRFGTTLPGGSYTSATGSDVCRFSFSSSNDSSMLRIRQADGTGATMARSPAGTTVRRGARMGGVVAASATVAYAVEYQRSGFFTSADAGASWTPSSIPGSYGNHTGIDAIGASTILITRQFGRVTRSTDGGATWSHVETPASVAGVGLYAVASPSATAAYAVGADGTILKSTDAGASWTSLASPIGAGVRLHSVAAPDDSNVFILANDGRFIRSNDGGLTWSVSTVLGAGTSNVSAPTSSTVWLTGTSSTVLRSTDGGVTFAATAATPTGMSTGYAISALDGNTAFVGGTGTSYRTTDGGVSWTALPEPSQEIVVDIDTWEGTNVFFALNGQTVAVTNNGGSGGWSYPIDNGGDLYGVWTNGRDHHVAVGTYGRIKRSTDSGVTWVRMASGTRAKLEDVELDGLHGWAVGTTADGGTAAVVATGDSGATWSRQPVSTAVDLEGVAALEHGRAIAVGDGGAIISTTNGGSSWTTRSSGTSANLNGVSGRRDFVVAAGDGGVLLVSADGGATWTARAVGATTNDLEDASVVNDQVAWVAGDNGTVLRTADAGATWTQVGSGNASHDYIQVSAPSRDVAWAQRSDWGSTSHWHRTADAGASWDLGGSTSIAPRASAAVDGETLVMAGMSGTVVRAAPATEVSDYAAATSNWASAGGMFGACLQAIGGGASVADWPVDGAGTAGRCEPNDADPWHAVPVGTATIARAAAGATGTVDIVWGTRVGDTAAPGRYTAGVQVEVIAPAV